jgi:hypothetical protein
MAADRTDDGRCREHDLARRIDDAFRAGDMARLRRAYDDWRAGTLGLQDAAESTALAFPNGPGPLWMGHPLVYAIYHSPVRFIRELLELDANPNVEVDDGFPPIIAAVSSARGVSGHPGRPDVAEILTLLFQFGAHPDQRGINDWTALCWAAGDGNDQIVDLLLAHGSDPRLRSGVDERENAIEAAERARHFDIAARLRAAADALDRRDLESGHES